MINNKKVCALVAVRAGSQRVKNKNLKSFNNTNLISLKLEILKNVTLIDDIILTSDSPDMIKLQSTRLKHINEMLIHNLRR